MLDLDAYLKRIGYSGARTPTLDTLREVHRLHPAAIPFENLNVIMGSPVPIDLTSVQEKLVRGGRGGWCFEQNLLLSEALRAMGFQVTDLAARVLWTAGEDVILPRSHRLMVLDLQGERFIADVGFGGQTLTGPLRLQTDIEQETPHGPFRLVHTNDGDYKLQALIAGEWKSTYRFDLQRQFAVDYEYANFFLSTSPASHFRAGLLVARSLPGLRHGLRNNHLSTHHVNGPSDKRVLTSVTEVRATLIDLFGLTLPSSPDLDRAIARVCEFP